MNASELCSRAQEVLLARLTRQHPGWQDDPAVLRAARQLSEGFGDEAFVQTPPLVERSARAAYLAYFTPRAIAASAHVMAPFARQLSGQPALDLGAGTGGAALVAALAGAKRVRLLDLAMPALNEAEALVQSAGATLLQPVQVQVQHANWLTDRVTDTVATVGISAFALGEMLAQASAEHVLERLRLGAPQVGTWFLVDAGDRARARRLQVLRDAALQAGWLVAAPCPHADGCPALHRAMDWCHSVAERSLLPPFAAFARALGRDDERMNLSYLVLTTSPELTSRRGIRVLGDAWREKGRARVPVCGAGGLRFLQALKRDRDASEALWSLQRGDVVEEEGLSWQGDTARVTHALRPRTESEAFPAAGGPAAADTLDDAREPVAARE